MLLRERSAALAHRTSDVDDKRPLGANPWPNSPTTEKTSPFGTVWPRGGFAVLNWPRAKALLYMALTVANAVGRQNSKLGMRANPCRPGQSQLSELNDHWRVGLLMATPRAIRQRVVYITYVVAELRAEPKTPLPRRGLNPPTAHARR
jgi:hypothetical protein